MINTRKVLIAEDHELIISGMMNLFSSGSRFHVVAHVENGQEVYNACRKYKPNILVLDLGLPGMGGIDIIPHLHSRWGDMRILVYTAHSEEFMAIKAMLAGADGYVVKSSSQQTLMAAMMSVSNGHQYIDPSLNHAAIRTAISTAGNVQELLTPREHQILNLICSGLTNRQVGESLCISIKTVETHRLNIMRKLKVHKVTELLNCARRLGLYSG